MDTPPQIFTTFRENIDKEDTNENTRRITPIMIDGVDEKSVTKKDDENIKITKRKILKTILKVVKIEEN